MSKLGVRNPTSHIICLHQNSFLSVYEYVCVCVCVRISQKGYLLSGSLFQVKTEYMLQFTVPWHTNLVLLVKNALQWKVDKWDTWLKKHPTGVQAVQNEEKVKSLIYTV